MLLMSIRVQNSFLQHGVKITDPKSHCQGWEAQSRLCQGFRKKLPNFRIWRRLREGHALRKHEDLSLNSQNSCKKTSLAVPDCNASPKGYGRNPVIRTC